ncbi:MAG: response regulator [Anaerolineales bacterium]
MNDLNAIEILLVEDNPYDAELTMRALRKHNFSNQLIHVQDGAEALDFLFGRGSYQGRNIEQHLRVVLLDLKLPKVNGLEVLRAIKSDPTLQHIPVVVVTSSKEDPDIKTAYELGANSYVVKPVEFDSFVNAMSHLGLYWLLVNRHQK